MKCIEPFGRSGHQLGVGDEVGVRSIESFFIRPRRVLVKSHTPGISWAFIEAVGNSALRCSRLQSFSLARVEVAAMRLVEERVLLSARGGAILNPF